MLKSSFGMVLAAKSRGVRYAKVMKPTGWSGGYNRKPPSGQHQFLPREQMLALTSRLER